MEVVLQHCLVLGLRMPSETTVQFISALLALVHLGMPALQAMQMSVRHDWLKAVKVHFKRLQGRSLVDCPFVAVLPMSPLEFATACPATYAAAFPGSLPVPSKLQNQDVASAMRLIPMRSSKTDVITARQLPMQPAVPVLNLGMGGLETGMGQQAMQFMSSMCQQMQQMQQVQTTTLQVLQALVAQKGSADSTPLSIQSGSPATKRFETQLALELSSSSSGSGAHIPQLTNKPDQNAAAVLAPMPSPCKPESSAPLKVPLLSPDAATKAVQDAMAKRAAGKAGKQEKPSCDPPGAKGNAKGKKNEKVAKAVVKKPKKIAAKPQQHHQSGRKPPSFSVEHSREQVLCRTGLSGPGQTKTYTFASCGGQEAAKKKAEAWLVKAKKQFNSN